VKKHISIIILTGIIFPFQLFGQTTIKGFVFEDSNYNQVKERYEKGMGNIGVSNGKDIVLTDQNGKYELPVNEGDIVFIIKPSGYSVPANEYNLPAYYYTYKPNGSPESKYPGNNPTGKLPKLVNFGLTKVEEKADFRILVFGDPQARNTKEMGYFYEGVVKELEEVNNVQFGISLGDLVFDDLNLFPSYIETIKKIEVPWYNVMGNHDMNLDADSDELSDETYEKYFGPATFSFNYGKVHFIVLDDVLYPDPRDGKGYYGGFTEKQFQFLENDLKHVSKDFLIVLAVHIPLSEPDNDSFNDSHRNRLFELLKDFPYTLSLSAHTHLQRQDFLGAQDGWLQKKPHHHFNVGTTCGSWFMGKEQENGLPEATMRDGTRQGYAFINFSNNTYSLEYKVAGKSPDYQFEIFAPKVLEKGKKTSSGIMANYFIGGDYDTLYYRIDNSSWKQMIKIKTFDPNYLHSLFEWDFTDKLFRGTRPANPVECEHIWYGGIDPFLEEGEHEIEVKAKNMFGKTHTQTKTYKILSEN
jgi:hypothetical protein